MTHSRRSCTVLRLLLSLVAVSQGVAEAAWTAELGWGGVVVPGHWAPLRVEARGFEGTWSVEVGGVTTLTFPGPGVFERPVYVADGLEVLSVRRFEGGLLREEKGLPVADREFPGHLILVDSVGPEVRQFLNSVLLPQEPVRVVPVAVSRWPSSFLAWGGVSALVTRDPGPVLSPAQRQALRAWVASGGRLAVVDRQNPSLLDQLGPVNGLGRVVSDPAKLGLEPYGTRIRAGTDFSPPVAAQGGEGLGTPLLLGFLTLWAVSAVGLSRGRKGSWGPTTAVAAAALIAVFVLVGTGAIHWDRGLHTHLRQVILPEDAGAVTSAETVRPPDRLPVVNWPLASPWGLAAWKASWQGADVGVRQSDNDRVALEWYGPSPPRSSTFAVRWTGTAVTWLRAGRPLESAPAALMPDAAWVARLAASAPEFDWTVGLDRDIRGTVCWMLPVKPKGRP